MSEETQLETKTMRNRISRHRAQISVFAKAQKNVLSVQEQPGSSNIFHSCCVLGFRQALETSKYLFWLCPCSPRVRCRREVPMICLLWHVDACRRWQLPQRPRTCVQKTRNLALHGYHPKLPQPSPLQESENTSPRVLAAREGWNSNHLSYSW
jgi:hypothetical protein